MEAPLRRDGDGRYHLDPDEVDAALARDGVAAYLLCSPHNPTGRVWSREDLTAVAEVCARRGVALLRGRNPRAASVCPAPRTSRSCRSMDLSAQKIAGKKIQDIHNSLLEQKLLHYWQLLILLI